MEWNHHQEELEHCPPERDAAAAAAAEVQPLRCGLLLQLPDSAMEAAFWRDAHILRAYAGSDMLAAAYILGGNIMVARALSVNRQDVAPWVHVTLALNILSCVLTLAWLLSQPKAYLQHRHKVGAANRLLRFACLLVMCFGSTPANQAALASSLRLTEATGKSEAVVALLNTCRPLFLTGLIVQAGGDWAISIKWWLPLQVATLLLSCHGHLRFQPCSLASDPYIAMILQQTCSGITRLHQTMLGIVVGQHLIGPLGPAERSVCGDLLLAARVVAWFSQAAYALLISTSIFVHLEARLKAQWVARQTGQRLVYGRFAWSLESGEGGCNWLAKAVEWVVLVPAAFWLLWVFSLWLVPKLPAPPCYTALCDGTGACPALTPCEGMLCQDPGLSAALLLFVEMVTVLAVKGFLLHSVVDLVRGAA